MVVRKISHFLLATTAFTLADMASPGRVWAGPEDGNVTAGSATISQSGPATTIHQSSDRAIIDWRSFNVGTSESVTFHQPGTTSLTVNRINDSQASQIDGQVSANGQIMLLNQNGIIFGNSARIDAAGIVASTGRVNDAAVMSGASSFEISPGDNANAAIINNGTITARDAGLVGLVAPSVENNGVIQARLGRVTLVGASRVTLDLAGDDLISIDVTDQIDGKVKNSGTITADGGTIALTAARAHAAVATSIINTGTLQANTVGIHQGRIILSAGGHKKSDPPPPPQASTLPAVVQAGTIQAASGSIEVVADTIEVAADSLTDASALEGSNLDGGTIKIGGDYQGQGNLPTAEVVSVDHSAAIKANGDASGQGSGGTIIFWADRLMSYRGKSEAEGGEEGDGGFIEVSGKNRLIFEGTASTRAQNGATGTLLLDPTNIDITAADSNVTGVSPFTPTADDVTSTVSAATLLAALAGSSVIVQTRATGSQPGNITVSAALTWGGSTTLTLEAHNNIIINQAISGPNLTLIAGGDVAINAALTGTGTLAIKGLTAATSIGLAGQAGTVGLANAELAFITNGWGDIVIGDAGMTAGLATGTRTWLDNLTLVTGTGVITVAGVQTMGANNLTFITDADIALNAAVTGTGTLAIRQSAAATTMGLNGTGTINLTTAEIGRITNGWGNIIIGRTDGSGDINIGALTWNDHLTIQTGSGGISFNGNQTMATNNLTIATDGNLNIGGNLTSTGTGTLTISGQSASTTMGLGTGQTGTIQLDNAEVTRLSNAWANIIIGRVDGTGDINVGTSAWADPLTLRTLTGGISINGAQTMAANSLTITTDGNLNIGGNLTSTGTGTLTISGQSASTTMGLGTAQTGTIQLDNAEVTRLSNAWANIIIGRVDGTGDINVGASAWADPLTLRTLTGGISINGAQTMAANNLTLTTDGDLNIGAALTGTGTLSIFGQSNATTMGLGTGQAGMIQLTDAEVTNLSGTFASIIIGKTTSTGDINIGTATWLDPLTIRTLTGGISINGTQTMGANGLTITTDGALNVGGTLSSTGTGTLTIAGQSAATTIGLGTGQAGTIQLSDAEVTNLSNGWASIVIGLTTGTGAINVGTTTWLDPLTLRSLSGVISINGAQTMGANNLTITTDANLGVNGALNGTGTLTIAAQSAATTMGLGTGQAGTIQLTDAEVTNLSNSWTSIIVGLATGTGAINVGAATWLDPLTLRSLSGVISINGTQTMGANNLTITTDSNLALGAGANLTGSGILTIASTTAATTIGLGTGTGTLSLNDTELNQISDGWNSIIIGNAAGTGAMTLGARSWNDNLTLRSTTGLISINGVQTMNGGNNLTISTDSNLAIGASGGLTGTGNLVIQTTTAATTIGLGAAQAGTLNLTDTELSKISDGWANITFGQAAGTGAINVGAMTWNDNLTLLSNSGAISINGAQDMGSNNLTFTTNADPTFGASLSGTGTLTVQGQAVATTVGIAGGAGTVNLSLADLANVLNGWNQIIVGRNDATGAMALGSYTWQYDMMFRTGTGIISVTGAQTSTGNRMTFETDGNMSIAANMTGSGILTIRPSANGTIMNIATGATGLNLTAAELNFIQDGWSQLVFGKTTTTGAVNIGARTWTDNVQYISGSGLMTAAAQTMNTATNLTFTTDSQLALTGTMVGTGGILAIEGASIGTGIGVGTGQTGSIVLDATDITRFGTTWGTGIRIGNSASTGNINIGTNSWSQPMTFLTQGNVILNGAQTSTRTSGNSLVFASLNGNFVNNTGSATPINPGTGTARYLIYSTSSGTDTYGTMTPPGATTAQTYFSYAPGAVVETGNRIIYNIGAAKVLYVQIDNKNKVYGDAAPALTWTYIGGLQGGDTLGAAITASSLSATGALTTDNVGITRTITGSFTTALGYTVSFTDGTLSVVKAPVSVQAVATSRAYGNANPVFTINYTGLKNGETAAVIDTQALGSSTATVLSNTGTYTITASGAIDNNYIFNYNTAVLTVVKADLTITADDKSRIYGDANPALTVTYSGFKNSETNAVLDTAPTLATGAIATTGAGTAAITLTGGLDNNYNLILVDGTLTINKATLTVTADNNSRIYGDANPALTVSYAGFKNGETSVVINTGATASTLATTASDVGTYAISASGAVDDNYDFTYVDGTLTINKALLTITADAQSRAYGDANPTLTASYSGFKNSDGVGNLDSAATLGVPATILSNVGTYTISASGAADGNYNFAYVDGTLTITKAVLSITADNKSRSYGTANPALTAVYSGFKNGDGIGDLDTAPIIGTLADPTSGVGTYAISFAPGFDNNYSFALTDGVLTISKATLSVTANDQTRIYGDADPALTIAYSGFLNGDTVLDLDVLPTASTTALITSNVGTYSITTSGGSDDNYNYVYLSGQMQITKADLTITADDQSRAYGDANPAFTFSYSGFKNGDTAGNLSALPGVTSAPVTANVGTYAIALSGGGDINYNYILQNGTLTISQAALLVTADNQTRAYGDANPSLTITYTGFKNGDTAGVLDVAASISTTANALSTIGGYLISVGGGSDNNYSLSFVNGNMTIAPANLIVAVDSHIRLIGAPNPPLTYSVIGLKNGETESVMSGLMLSTTALQGSPEGQYAITASGASAANYSIFYNFGVMTIVESFVPDIADLPRTATRTLVTPSPDTVSYSSTYNAPVPYSFISSQLVTGQERGTSTDTISGYIPVYYHTDPFDTLHGDPLIFIDPLLFAGRDVQDILDLR